MYVSTYMEDEDGGMKNAGRIADAIYSFWNGKSTNVSSIRLSVYTSYTIICAKPLSEFISVKFESG